MAKFGSEQNPAWARAQTLERANELVSFCDSHGWIVSIGVEPDKPEDISEIRSLANTLLPPKFGRNHPCPCGSNLKFKKCCSNKPLASLDIL